MTLPRAPSVALLPALPALGSILIVVLVAAGQLGLLGAAGATPIATGSGSTDRFAVVGGYLTLHSSVDGEAEGYATIVNRSGGPVQIDALTSPVAASVILHHGHVGSPGSGGGPPTRLYCGLTSGDASRVLALHSDTEPLVVPARSQLSVAPGHGKIALTRLVDPVHVGERIPLTLYLDDGSTLTVSVPIR